MRSPAPPPWGVSGPQGRLPAGQEAGDDGPLVAVLSVRLRRAATRLVGRLVGPPLAVGGAARACAEMMMASSSSVKGSLFTHGLSWLHHLRRHARALRPRWEAFLGGDTAGARGGARRRRQDLPERPEMPWAMSDQLRAPWRPMSCRRTASSCARGGHRSSASGRGRRPRLRLRAATLPWDPSGARTRGRVPRTRSARPPRPACAISQVRPRRHGSGRGPGAAPRWAHMPGAGISKQRMARLRAPGAFYRRVLHRLFTGAPAEGALRHRRLGR